MRITTCCYQCLAEENGRKPENNYRLQLNDNDTYEFLCRRGHQNRMVLEQNRYELLFVIAVNAVADGYYREAVLSATACCERLFEHFVKVVLSAHNVPELVIDETWKYASRSSERQTGMFLGAFAREFSSPPKLIATKQVEFRNSVAHRGLIPSRAQAIAYISHIADVTQPIVRAINDSDRLRDVHEKLLSNKTDAILSGSDHIHQSSLCLGSRLSMTNTYSDLTLEQEIDILEAASRR